MGVGILMGSQNLFKRSFWAKYYKSNPNKSKEWKNSFFYKFSSPNFKDLDQSRRRGLFCCGALRRLPGSIKWDLEHLEFSFDSAQRNPIRLLWTKKLVPLTILLAWIHRIKLQIQVFASIWAYRRFSECTQIRVSTVDWSAWEPYGSWKRPSWRLYQPFRGNISEWK